MADSGDIATEDELDLDRPVLLYPLVYQAAGDEVTIGRSDIDSYGIFPADGAEVVRRLAAGESPRAVVEWFGREHDEDLDIVDVVACLRELDLVRTPGSVVTAPPVRFQRLGRMVFSTPAWCVYIGLISLAIIDMVRDPELVPSYHKIFFTSYYTLIEVSLFVATVPLLLLHESFHALAGRRLGVRSRLTVSRRFYYIVLETSLDGLVAVPRRRRYLPIVAGVLADLVAIAACVLGADLSRDATGALPVFGQFLLAVAFTTFLRVVWQFFLYLRTDLYVLVSTMLGCVDLHSTARRLLANRWNRLVGRADRLVDVSSTHPADRRAARWYSWLFVVGYLVSLAIFALTGVPIVYQMITAVASRFTGAASTPHLLDSIVFSAFAIGQLVVIGGLALRDRMRARRARVLHHVVN